METNAERSAEKGERGRWLSWTCYTLAIAVIAFQFGMIAYARFDDARYFCWAPHDVMWTFHLTVELDGQTLEHDAAIRRYRLRRKKRHEHAIEHVKRVVRQYEETYGKKDHARVLLTYAKNGGEEVIWNWPQ